MVLVKGNQYALCQVVIFVAIIIIIIAPTGSGAAQQQSDVKDTKFTKLILEECNKPKSSPGSYQKLSGSYHGVWSWIRSFFRSGIKRSNVKKLKS